MGSELVVVNRELSHFSLQTELSFTDPRLKDRRDISPIRILR